MKRAVRIAALVLAAVVIAFAAAYLTLVHPNDARVTRLEGAPVAPASEARTTQRASLVTTAMEQSSSMAPDAYRAAKAALEKRLPAYALVRSARFVSPFQVYLPVGRYPARLDARDAVFVPKQETLRFRPKLAGRFTLRVGLASPGPSAHVAIAVRGAPVGEVSYAHTAREPKVDGWWYRAVGRYLDVDPWPNVDQWSDATFAVDLSEGDDVELRCAGGDDDCVVADVAFDGAEPAPRRNVIVFLVDTMRGDALDKGHAPHLAELAAKGVRFTNALSPGNMTSPSTNGFLACRKPSSLGSVAFAYGLAGAERERFYAQRRPSFPQAFSSAGYETTMIGNVSVVSEAYGVGVHHGFARQVAIETDGYDTPQIAREARRWLRANASRRFFLYVHFNGPHAPYRAPWRDIRATYPGPVWMHSYADTLLWLYQSEIAYTDRYMDEVLREVDALGLTKDTVMVLTADHGDQHTERAFTENEAAPDFKGAYFDHGATLYSDEVRVPLVIVQPPGVATPRVRDEYVSTMDVGATLARLAGVPAPTCDGGSLADAVQGAPIEATGSVFGIEAFQGRAIVVDRRYKYIRYYEAIDKRVYDRGSWSGGRKQYFVPEQVFDLLEDPGEAHELGAERPELLARMRDAYRAYYDIKARYELVVELPEATPATASFAADTKLSIDDGEGKVEERDGRAVVTAMGPARVVVAVDGWNEALPSVRIGDAEVPVAMTSMRLPLHVAPHLLPSEAAGRYSLLAPTGKPNAYLLRVEDDGRANRRMVAGNPAFDKVLREWGYLNDK
jgi:arylsulfatase A-like enzyme